MICKLNINSLWQQIAIFSVISLISKTTASIPNCDFHDTIKLADALKLNNGSYIYEGIVIPPDLIGEYDFVILFDDKIEQVPKHLRACVCKLKPCIRFCCHPRSFVDPATGECSDELEEDLSYEPFVNITYNNGSSIETHVLNEFVPQMGLPCSNPYALYSEVDDTDDWELFANGTLLRMFDQQFLTKRDYCFNPVMDKVTNETILKPHNCPMRVKPSLKNIIIQYLLTISVVFLILTILVYLFVPKLQNLHGKCLICYLCALAMAYTLLNLEFHLMDITGLTCLIIGYLGYFSFMSAFLWSSVISYDVWSTFRNLGCSWRRSERMFRVYSLFAWGIGFALLLLIVLLDDSNIDEDWKPGVGAYACWFNTQSILTAFIYFFGPELLLLIFNFVIFVLCSKRIIEAQRKLKQSEMREEDVQRLSTHKRNYSLYLRLFFIMGIVWLLDVASYLSNESIFFDFGEFINASQGIIIFVLLVLRKRVRQLIIDRIRGTTSNHDRTNEGISLQERTRAVSIMQ